MKSPSEIFSCYLKTAKVNNYHSLFLLASQKQMLTVYDWAISLDKKEIYDFLVVQGNAYLPANHEWNHEFIREIVQGIKKVNLTIRNPYVFGYKGMRHQSVTGPNAKNSRNTKIR